ncbi:MAG: type II toxin-antitoxin system PemK/MazF family toxin [Acidimicrobiia bacterium]|nr:type II toxin-antitoxin system PemK/MazF family toxin [Acidimicrobiia bacterium]
MCSDVTSGGRRCGTRSTRCPPHRPPSTRQRGGCGTLLWPTASISAEQRLVRGDLWRVDLGTRPEHPEQAFSRPALIVSDDRLHHRNLKMVIVVPATSVIRGLPLHIVVEPDSGNGLSAATAFQTEQIRAVSTARLTDRLGRLDLLSRHAIDEVLRNALSL